MTPLQKGRNNMNKLVEIVIRWYIHKVPFHNNIQKKVAWRNWCLQRYIRQQELDQTKIPEEQLIKTLIYEVNPSDNQAEHGLRETAELSQGD